jgi:hypothetical protein
MLTDNAARRGAFAHAQVSRCDVFVVVRLRQRCGMSAAQRAQAGFHCAGRQPAQCKAPSSGSDLAARVRVVGRGGISMPWTSPLSAIVG